MSITFVIPVYNERETLETLTAGIVEYVPTRQFRVLFVDDGSTDGSYEELLRLRETYPMIDIIKFRRNFGKSQALAAAFANAKGDIVIMMDSDLQDDPKEIPRLLEKLDEGYDIVCGWKAHRRDPWHKTVPSRVFNLLVSRAFGLDLHDINTGFKAIRMEVARRLPLYGEMHRMIAVFAAEMGYRVTEIPVEHHPRRHGRSKYGFERYYRGAVDAYAVWFLSRHGQSPGHFFAKRGLAALTLGGPATIVGALLVGFNQWHSLGMLLGCFGIAASSTGVITFAVGLLCELLRHEIALIDPTLYIEKEIRG